MQAYQSEFIAFAIKEKALKFGSFQLKSGRISPYFFNAGVFCTGESLAALGHFYTEAIKEHAFHFDALFGPAYKGIPLVAAISQAWFHKKGQSTPFSYNRKEKKEHGEGGQLVGGPLANQDILLIDDVITAGTAIQETLPLLKEAGARLSGILVALDRQEVDAQGNKALPHLEKTLNIPVKSLITLDHLLQFIEKETPDQLFLAEMQAYRAQYCQSS